MMIRPVVKVAACLFIAVWAPGLASAQGKDNGPELQPLPQQVSVQFDQLLEEIAGQKEDVATLTSRASEREGLMADLLLARRDGIWTAMFRNTVSLAELVAVQQDDGRDVAAYWNPLVTELSELPGNVRGALDRLQDSAVFPSADMATQEFVIADQKLFKAIHEQNKLFRALVDYVEIAEAFGLDPSGDHEYLVDRLSDSVANLSVFLQIAKNDIDMLRSTIVTLPNNTELADWHSAASTRIQLTAEAMREAVELMTSLGMETRLYRQQLLTSIGEITTDVLDVGIVASLMSEWTKSSTGLLVREGPRLLFRFLLVLLILFVAVQFSKLVQKLADRALGSSRVRMSNLLRRMIVSTVRNLIVILGILLAISQLGISLGPLLAGLGIAGFIIGFALQDTLSNFASGVMILLYRPFDVGDVVEAGGVSGKVSHMSLVNTTFMTLDNQRLIVPNNLIWSSVITNVTAQRVRRIDLMFGISYDDDIEKAEKILQGIVDEHEAILEKPEPVIKLHELSDSSVNFVVRPWVRTSDYWETYWDVTKAVKIRFDEEGISIPYPQRDVHVIGKGVGSNYE